MDLEKLGHLMDEAKGADVAFYLLLAFGCICPGFIILFFYKPDLILIYDFSKLLLMCVCVSGAILIFFMLAICTCIMQAGGELTLRPCLMVGSAASVIAVCMSLRAPYFVYFTSDLLLWIGLVAWAFSIAACKNRNWFFKYFCNMGMLFLLVAIPNSYTVKEAIRAFQGS